MLSEVAGLKVKKVESKGALKKHPMLILEPGWEQIAKDIADWLEKV